MPIAYGRTDKSHKPSSHKSVGKRGAGAGMGFSPYIEKMETNASNPQPAQTGNASNPSPLPTGAQPPSEQLLPPKSETYLREGGNIEDMPDAQDEQAAEEKP